MEQYFSARLSASSQKTYAAGQKHYIDFCNEYDITPLPLDEHKLCQYVAVLAGKSMASSSIKVYLSAARQLQIGSGGKDPKISEMAQLSQVLKGIQATQAAAQGTGSTNRLPVTPDMLRAIKAVWEGAPLTDDKVMLWGAMMLCFFGFCRSGEICIPTREGFDATRNLTFEDISVDDINDPKYIQIKLKKAKNDQLGKGALVCLGRTGGELCPVNAVLAWLVRRGNAAGPLFHYANGAPLTQSDFTMELRRAVELIGVESQRYSGHSFRAGAATAAANQGIEDSTIKLLGRWHSSAYQVYIKTPPVSLANLTSRIAGLPASNQN